MNVRLAALIGVLAVVTGFWWFGGGGSSAAPQTISVSAKCSAADCGHEFTAKVPDNFDRFTAFPRACAKCNQKTAYQMVVCVGCEAHHPNNESRERFTKCSKCGTNLPAE